MGFAVAQNSRWDLVEFSNRFEGPAPRPDARRDLRILGLHRRVAPARNAILAVSFVLPSEAPVSGVSIEAAELNDLHNYVMRAKPARWQPGALNTFQPWPTRDIIDPTGVDPDNIGVVVFYTRGTDTVYLPVDLLSNSSPPPPPADEYHLHFETGREIQTLHVVITTDGTPGKTIAVRDIWERCDHIADPGCFLFAAGSNQHILLSLTGVPSGIYHILLSATSPNVSGQFSQDFYMFK